MKKDHLVPLVVDHINGNGLDNRRENIRLVTNRQNQHNIHRKKLSRYPGLCWGSQNKKWQVRIRYKGKRIYLGYYSDELEAATVYRVACKVLTGDDVFLPEGIMRDAIY